MFNRFTIGVVIVIALIVIIIIVVVLKCQKMNSNLVYGISDFPSAHRVNAKQVTYSQQALIYEDELMARRKLLFPLQIQDIRINHDVKSNPNYNTIMAALKGHPRAVNRDEMKFMLQYKAFLDRSDVYSMASVNDIDQVYLATLKVFGSRVEGDFVECGVWRGGMLMFMKTLIDYFGGKNLDLAVEPRTVWGFDAFDTFPAPTGDDPVDNAIHPLVAVLYNKPISVYDVEAAFLQFGLSDERVHLVKGLFTDTIPVATRSVNDSTNSALQKIALLRIDNDYYENVTFVLDQLYQLVNKGGIVIIDDYNNPVVNCRQAVLDWRAKHAISDPIIDTYGGAIYWIKS